MTNVQPLIIIAGPTASGKSALAVELAKRLPAEIISADSIQVYRHMDIGSAKITPEEMQGIPHHLIDVLDPDEEFNVVVFQQMAKEAYLQIRSRHKIPMVVGGTGFYIQALLYDIDFESEDENTEIRERLERQADTEGIEALYALLREKDPNACLQIHPHNRKRVIRALEFYEKNDYPISEHNEKMRQKESPYNYLYFALEDARKDIYQRIEQRVDQMMAQGLVDEVENLLASGYDRHLVSMQGLGYKEICAYLAGELSLAEAIDLIKKETRHFAKRQITWLKREPDVIRLPRPKDANETEALCQKMLQMIKDKGITP